MILSQLPSKRFPNTINSSNLRSYNQRLLSISNITHGLPFDETDIAEKSPCGNYVRYKKMLGRGAFKDVYIGSNVVRGAGVAWNQICLDDEATFDSPEKQESLYSEAVMLSSLSHSNIMKCYSFWLDYGAKSMNMITELFACGSLKQYMKKLGGVDTETVKDWGRQILRGLHYLHTQSPSIVHRDLKCDNMFIDVTKGEIKIGDFGLATRMERGRGPLRALVGTPEFMAPEYYDEEYDELVVVYAFGMCFMELVTLECPYSECTNPAQIFKKVSTGIKPRALEKMKNAVVKEMIEKCLLPASSRPSAVELLKDPFFSSSSVENEQSMNSSTLSQEMDDESILSGISALYDSMSLSDGKRPDGLASSCYRCSSGDACMNSRITVASSADMYISVPSSKSSNM